MHGGSDRGRKKIASDILSYFLRNPTAMDSFEGIARWRLLDEMARRNILATEEALHWLIADEYLIEEQVPGGKPIYRLNNSKRADAELLVEAMTQEDSKRRVGNPTT